MAEPAESTPNEAWEEDECLLCVPASHPNCEKYTTVPMLPDPLNVPLGEDYEDHLISVPCAAAITGHSNSSNRAKQWLRWMFNA